MTNVYFTNKFDSNSIKELFNKVYSDLEIRKDERVAIKVHFGEEGNTKFVSPKYIEPIIDSLKKINNNFFITDCNTLYKGMRTNATDHLKLAEEHEFGKLGKIIIADGEQGDYEETIKINGKIFSEAKIGKHIADSDIIIGISHFKGHELFGFSGSIKNLGMGCASKAGKQLQHSNSKPTINDNCKLCMSCVKMCNYNAIIVDSKLSIDKDICVGCGKCISVCDNKAIRTPFFSSSDTQKRTTEYALALKNKKGIFFNFLNNITKHCDCNKQDSEIVCEDIGIVASIDPVACDKASYDLVFKKMNKDIFKEIHKNDGTLSFDYAEEIGLGEKTYKLIEVKD